MLTFNRKPASRAARRAPASSPARPGCGHGVRGRPALHHAVHDGYKVTPGGGNLFFQLVNARYEKGAMILTSNRGFAEWGEVFASGIVKGQIPADGSPRLRL